MSTGDGFHASDHVTEREAGPWHDCTFAAMLETIRAGFPDGALIPATVAEKEAYRRAAGLPDDHGGATIGQAVDAAVKRYNLGAGWFVTSDWGDVRTALLIPGFRLAVQGSMAHVPAHLRRWETGFTGAHTVAARGNATAPYWCDPLAPKDGVYAGEPVTIATWQAFFTGLSGAEAFITEIGALTEGGPVAFKFAFSRWSVKAGTPFFDAPDGQKIGTIKTAREVTGIGIPLDRREDATPGQYRAWRAILHNTSALDKINGPKAVYVKKSALTAIPTSSEWDDFLLAALRDPLSYTWDDPVDPPADDTPYSEADMAAAEAAVAAKWEAWLATHPED